MSTEEIHLPLQADRTTDPTTGTIALRLNVANEISFKSRAVPNNLTFKSLGNIVGEADVISWGEFILQNSGESREV